MSWEVIEGDCFEKLAELPDDSVDAVVTDPPYGIGFMGHEWDQPGIEGKKNGAPAPFASGRDYPGSHEVGGRREPPGQRRVRDPKPSGFDRREGVKALDGDVQVGDHRGSRLRAGAMHAGRYDLSHDANRKFQEWCEGWARECLRVLKPGGHMLVFGGSRTYHRLTCGVEDAGFEIRDSLMWLFGSGFPKSLNVAKAIDKALGQEGELGEPKADPRWQGANNAVIDGEHRGGGQLQGLGPVEAESEAAYEYIPATEEGQRFNGWGTALKPAHEPIVVARKPFRGTVAGNVLEHGTGGLNVGGTQLDTEEELRGSGNGVFPRSEQEGYAKRSGRWPGNVALSHTEECELLGTARVPTAMGSSGGDPEGTAAGIYSGGFPRGDGRPVGYGDEDGLEEVEEWSCAPGCPVAELNAQSGELKSGQLGPVGTPKKNEVFGEFARANVNTFEANSGGAARFFYCAKASRKEREAGLEAFELRAGELTFRGSMHDGRPHTREGYVYEAKTRNIHPTVKPMGLMRWLTRLITPPGGKVLDPFTGSGTTGAAVAAEGFDFVGIEREPEYVAIAKARIAWWEANPEGPKESRAPRPVEGQLSLG